VPCVSGFFLLVIGNYEIYHKFVNDVLVTERTTVNISDDNKKIATAETLTVHQRSLKSNPVAVIRYQYDNHLGSAALELDENANIISYEEYHAFGTTSYRSGRTETETSQKRYKYVGKERDEETGLYYYGFRYYAAWLCRFVSVDPLQFEYPHYTPFQYAGNKPISYIDLDGLEEGTRPYEVEKFPSISKKIKNLWYNLSGQGIEDAKNDKEREKAIQNLKVAEKQLEEVDQFVDYMTYGVASAPVAYFGCTLGGPILMKAISAETALISTTSWSSLPAMKTLTGMGVSYFAGSNLTRIGAASTDAIGQFGINYYNTKNVRASFFKINMSSVIMSGAAPGSKLSTLGINGFVSSIFKYDLFKGNSFGSFSEVGYGTLTTMVFGRFTESCSSILNNSITKGMNIAKQNYSISINNANDAFSPELKESMLKSAEGYLRQAESFEKLILPSKVGAFGLSVTGQTTKNILLE